MARAGTPTNEQDWLTRRSSRPLRSAAAERQIVTALAEVNVLERIFGKERSKPTEMVIVRLNAKLQPVHSGEFFEDPLDAQLKAKALGEVSGGGTMQEDSGEIEYCDIELSLVDATEETINSVVASLDSLGVPKGSSVHIASSGFERRIGKAKVSPSISTVQSCPRLRTNLAIRTSSTASLTAYCKAKVAY